MEYIKKCKKLYLYERIVSYIKVENKKQPKLFEYNESLREEMFSNLIKVMNDFSEKNGIVIESCNINDLSKIFNNFNEIIKWHNKSLNKNEDRKYQLIIIKNLLFSKKDKEIYSNFNLNNGNINENIFDKNTFIYYYISQAITKIFNSNFDRTESTKLKDLYLYLIFQINDPQFIKTLKILTYKCLYKNDLTTFIKESSESIVNNENINSTNLKELQMKQKEFDSIDIKEVSNNVISFFNENKNDNNYLLNFFNRENIINNYNKIISEVIPQKDIVIDKLEYDKNKIHLFSPGFLIVNGLKSKIECCDLEIFNNDNYGVDIFVKFITEIINNINDSIDKNNFSNDFMSKHLIKLHKMDFNHYISAKLDYDHINELRDSFNKIKETKTNDFIKIKVKDVNKYKNKDDENDIKKNTQEEISMSILSNSLLSDYKKKYSDFFENVINQRLIKNIDKNKLIFLPNILFMMNLKIPIINENKNLLLK
jgi:hypothetical protein